MITTTTISATTPLPLEVTDETISEAIANGKRDESRIFAESVRYICEEKIISLIFHGGTEIKFPTHSMECLSSIPERSLESVRLCFMKSALCLDDEDIHISIVNVLNGIKDIEIISGILFKNRDDFCGVENDAGSNKKTPNYHVYNGITAGLHNARTRDSGIYKSTNKTVNHLTYNRAKVFFVGHQEELENFSLVPCGVKLNGVSEYLNDVILKPLINTEWQHKRHHDILAKKEASNNQESGINDLQSALTYPVIGTTNKSTRNTEDHEYFTKKSASQEYADNTITH
jgi:hypothetical protein